MHNIRYTYISPGAKNLTDKLHELLKNGRKRVIQIWDPDSEEWEEVSGIEILGDVLRLHSDDP